MQGYYGGLYASNFNRFGKMYRVMVQADPDLRKNMESLKNIKVRTETIWLRFPSSFDQEGVWTGYYQPFQYVYIYQSDGCAGGWLYQWSGVESD